MGNAFSGLGLPNDDGPGLLSPYSYSATDGKTLFTIFQYAPTVDADGSQKRMRVVSKTYLESSDCMVIQATLERDISEHVPSFEEYMEMDVKERFNIDTTWLTIDQHMKFYDRKAQ